MWSYDLLAPLERRLLPALSVFAGGFTLDAPRGVCADETVPAEDVATGVAHLVDQSLLVADHLAAGTRYRLLETIRAFAAEELAGAGREDEVRDRHLTWYARWSYAQATAPGNWSALHSRGPKSTISVTPRSGRFTVNDPTPWPNCSSTRSTMVRRRRALRGEPLPRRAPLL